MARIIPTNKNGTALFEVPYEVEETFAGTEDHARFLLKNLRVNRIYAATHIYRGANTDLEQLLARKTDRFSDEFDPERSHMPREDKLVRAGYRPSQYFMAFTEPELFSADSTETPFGYITDPQRGRACILVYAASGVKPLESKIAGTHTYTFIDPARRTKALVAVFAYDEAKHPF